MSLFLGMNSSFWGNMGKIETNALVIQCLGCKRSWVRIPPRRPRFSPINTITSFTITVRQFCSNTGLNILYFPPRRHGVSGATVGKKSHQVSISFRDWHAQGVMRLSSYFLTFSQKSKSRGITWNVREKNLSSR
jgi:hypothetical protein